MKNRIKNKAELESVNKNINKFAFDVDGTLVDDHFKLNKGVYAFIYEMLLKEKCQFMICTGSSYNKASKVVSMIKDEIVQNYKNGVEVAKQFQPSIACYGGSVIVKNNRIVRDKRIERVDFDKIEKIVNQIDEKAIILLNKEDGMHYIEPKMISKDNLKIKFLQLLQATKGEGGFNTIGESAEDYYKLIDNNEIGSLEILSLSSSKNKAITKALSESIADLTISAGTTIQVSNGSKLEAIKTCLGENVKKVLYVGDGYNDIPAMQEAGISFALGKKVKVLESADFAVENFENITVAFVDSDYKFITYKSEVVLNEAKEAEEKKRAKKENSTIKNAISKVKGSFSSKKQEEREM
ncbi:MAG: HAD family phosphatase [Clostridia bacterium]|nr:HAD family phosphatase [Clostridia bacterium]